MARGEDGRPLPFQEILKRFRRKYKVEGTAKKIPLGADALRSRLPERASPHRPSPLRERRALPEEVADSEILASQTVTSDPEKVAEIYEEAIGAGHEGACSKPRAVAVRSGEEGEELVEDKAGDGDPRPSSSSGPGGAKGEASFLGSYRLASPDPDTGRLEDVGWVATGSPTRCSASLPTSSEIPILVSEGMEVELKPEVIFEVAFEEIQRSPNYSSGYALRFPRLVRVRDDKAWRGVTPSKG